MSFNTLVESYDHAGFTVEIHYDEDYSSDMALDYSRVGRVIIEHRQYALGDEQQLPEFEHECPYCEGSGNRTRLKLTIVLDHSEEDELFTLHEAANLLQSCTDHPLSTECYEQFICPECAGAGTIAETAIEYFKREEGARVVIPLDVVRDWSPSLRAGTANEPDELADGYIFDTPEGVKQCLGEDVTDEQIEKALRAEVEEYSNATSGNVYGFIVKDEAGDEVEDGSLWGMVGDLKGMVGNLQHVRSEANAVAEAAAKDAERERQEIFAMACRDVVTVDR